MKTGTLVWLPLAFAVGGIVGYYGPAEELRAREAHAEEAQAKAVARERRDAFGSFAKLVNIPDEARRARHSDPVVTNAVADATVAAPTNAPVAVRRPPRINPQDLRARIDEAADLGRARTEMVRASAVEKLGLDADGEKAFDAAIAAMNDSLRDSMQTVADEIAASAEMTPELGVRLMGDLSATLAEAYDAVGACVGGDRRGEVSKMMLVEFVDPSVAEPLIAVQDKLELPR
mgnify:CR=1 FL=1